MSCNYRQGIDADRVIREAIVSAMKWFDRSTPFFLISGILPIPAFFIFCAPCMRNGSLFYCNRTDVMNKNVKRLAAHHERF